MPGTQTILTRVPGTQTIQTFCIVVRCSGNVIFERMRDDMEEIKFAQLDHTQLEKINELEKKIGVTLVAYDAATMPNQGSGSLETDHSSQQNHPS